MSDESSLQTADDPKPVWFGMPLSKLQSLVAIGAGVFTMLATGASLIGMSSHRPPVQGELVAAITTARYRTPLRDATVEILTPAAAVVTTLSADDEGRIQFRLREGQYRLRVTHPQYVPDQKDIHVWAGQRADIRVALASRPPAPKTVAAAPKNDESVRKLFEKLSSIR